MKPFPSMKAKELLRLLCREPLGYSVARQQGSHRILVSDRYPRLLFAFHDGVTVPPGLVRKILTQDVGLSVDVARELLGA